MAISLKSTSEYHVNGVKALVYGQSGAGKTMLAASAPNPVIISAESGLLSLSETNIPYIEVTSMEGLIEAYKWASGSDEAAKFDTVCLDSISEIAEVVLSHEKENSRDPRQAYGEMQDQMSKIIRHFRDLSGKHVYFSAKVGKSEDETGRALYYPSMPGNKMAQSLPFFFDEVFALRVENDAEGNIQRALMTQPDALWQAKDRSGKLGQWEPCDLSAIIDKITSKREKK